MGKTDQNLLPEMQAKAHAPEQPSTERTKAHEGCQQEPRRAPGGRSNAVVHGIFSQSPLEALGRLGENVKRLERIERKFRAELKPVGMLGGFWFERLWSSFLRCLLVARVEGIASGPFDQVTGLRCSPVKQGETFLLAWGKDGLNSAALSSDLLGHLALAARYDRHFSREMYRAFAILLVLRSRGEDGLEECIARMVGLERENQ